MLSSVHHVQLACPPGSEDASRAYYVGILGMLEIAKPAALAARGGLWFRTGGVELHLGVEQDFRPARKADPGIEVGDLDAFADRLASLGAVVDWDVGFPGRRRFYSEDPHGNRIELLSAPDDGPGAL